jgi:hypothetical protein
MKSLPVPESPVNLTFSDENSDSDEVHGKQEGENIDYDPTFKQVVPHLNPIHYYMEILATLSVI